MCVGACVCGTWIVGGSGSAHVKSVTPIKIKQYVSRNPLVMPDAANQLGRDILLRILTVIGDHYLVERLDARGDERQEGDIQTLPLRRVDRRVILERMELGGDVVHPRRVHPPNTGSGKRIGLQRQPRLPNDAMEPNTSSACNGPRRATRGGRWQTHEAKAAKKRLTRCSR